MNFMKYDIAIIGAGPGGYVSAIRAAQLGAKVVLIEKENIGGVCLNWGCIPTKAILASVDRYNEAKKFSKFGINIENLTFDYKKISDRKLTIVEKLRKSLSQLIKSYGIDVIYGEASIETKNMMKVTNSEALQEVEFDYLILATGSRPVSLPGLPIDHKFILDTNDILALEELPDSIMIIGSGASGIEWSRIFSSLGKKVILVEIASKLAPMLDSSISERLERIFKRNKIEYYTETKVEKIENKTVTLQNCKEFQPDIIFLAAGRIPNSDIKGLDEIGIITNNKYIQVDDNLKTNIDNIYAIGDVTGKLLLAHVASHQGVKAVENILLGKQANINYNTIPKVIYGTPEIGSVGCSEDELIAQNIDYEKSLFPMSAIGKTIIEDELEGFIKVLASKDKILGVHLIADGGDYITQQAAIAMNSNLTPEELKETVFAHPTNSEALYEALLGINGHPLHLPK
ncbi:MAG: dihydrolipoyl dehydrogenase [Candidatus Melainabacteria bacterium GWF2_32_7]|nr:MAG: dihydrolipoyl dehydrogenase [Candidatus Melainabacteria bacterium GWF2_32_7]